MNKILKCLLSVFMVISLAFSSLAALVAFSPSVARAADSTRAISITSWNISSGYSVSFANADRVAVARAENVRNTSFQLFKANPDGSLGAAVSPMKTYYDTNTEGSSSLILSGDKTSGWFDISNLANGSYALVGMPKQNPVVKITFTIATPADFGSIGGGIASEYICPVCGTVAYSPYNPQGTPDDIQTYNYFNSVVSPCVGENCLDPGYRLCENCFNNFKNESVSIAPYEKTNEIVSTIPDAVVRCSSCNLPVPSSADLDANGKCLHCTSSNFVYRTYRLFDAVVDEKDYSASNIEYSSPEMAAILKEYCGTEYAQDAAEKIKENIKNNDELVSGSYGMELARKVANSDITPISISEFGGSNTFDKEGYYLILTMDSKGGVASVASLPIFRLIGEDQLTITSKTALPTLKKEYISNGVSGSSVSAGLGDTIRVRLTGTLPDNFASFDIYQYRIEDAISYLTPIEGSASIKVQNADITDWFSDIRYKGSFSANCPDLTANNFPSGRPLANTDKIIIEYDAVLSSLPDAASAGDPVRGFSNAAELTYSNNALNVGSTGTLTASAFVRSYALDLLKVDNATADPLANVGFTVKKSFSVVDEYDHWSPSTEDEMNLPDVMCSVCHSFFTSGVHLPCGFITGEDGCPYCNYSLVKYLTRTDDGLFSFADDPYIFSTGEDGRISLEGLGAASYTIDEVLPANDYRPLAGSIDFNLEYSSVAGGFSATANCPELVSVDDSGSLITVKNMKVLSLPMTGETGAVICTVLGVGCLIVSLVLYLRKRSERKFLE